MIKVIDKDACRVIRAELDKVVAELGKKLGISIKVGSGSYTPSSVTFKVESSVIAADGSVLSKEAETFKLYAKSYGLLPDDLGKTFKTFQGEYKITGLKARSYKFPIMAECVKTGKRYKFPVDSVVRGLGRKPTVNAFSVQTEDVCGETGAWGEV